MNHKLGNIDLIQELPWLQAATRAATSPVYMHAADIRRNGFHEVPYQQN